MDRLAVPFHRRREERLAFAHALSTSSMIGGPRDVDRIDPFADQLRDPIDRYGSVATRVSILLPCRSPSDVSRFVHPIVIDPVDRMFLRRSSSYIAKESFKRTTPRITHGYSTCSVVGECSMVRVVTTRNHRAPCSIFGCHLSVTSFTMSTRRCSKRRSKFTSKAPARFRPFGLEQLGENDHFVSTFTTTPPSCALVRRRMPCEDCQTSENLPLKVVQSHGPISAQNWKGDKCQMPG